MKPPAFRYYRPTSTSEATSVLVEDEDALVLAGGQSLIPLLNLRMARPSVLVDVSRIPEMQRIRAEEHWFSVGAAVRQRSLEESPMIRRENGALIEALGNVGHRQIRVRGTVGGSLAHADPVGELPCLAVAGGWTICVRGADGVREVEADGFFLGAYTTALRPGELIESLRIPRVPSKGVFRELARRRGDFAIAALAVVATPGWDAPDDARVVAIGLGDVPQRLRRAEVEILRGQGDRAAAAAAADAAELVAGHKDARYKARVIHALMSDATESLHHD